MKNLFFIYAVTYFLMGCVLPENPDNPNPPGPRICNMAMMPMMEPLGITVTDEAQQRHPNAVVMSVHQSVSDTLTINPWYGSFVGTNFLLQYDDNDTDFEVTVSDRGFKPQTHHLTLVRPAADSTACALSTHLEGDSDFTLERIEN
jgi:hypothetical protein